jgi:hypothetical protein
VTTLRIVEKPAREDAEPGMMWRYPPGDEGGRECWWIVLPNTDPRLGTPGHPGKISWRTTDHASSPPHEMWDVSGAAPLITVAPSIDVECWVAGPHGKSVRDGSYWHGFITNGEMTP